MKSWHLFTTTSLGVIAAFSAIACSGSDVEPADQSQRAGLTQSAEPPAAGAMPVEARGDHRRFGARSPEKFIERFDENRDGALQAAELPKRMQEHLGDIDKSGDGVVSKDELTAHFEAKKAEHAQRFAEHAKRRFEKRDTNRDGTLDQSELGERWAKLSVADSNGDQKLTPDELKAAFETGKLGPMRGEHRRHFEGPDKTAPVAPPAATPAPAL